MLFLGLLASALCFFTWNLAVEYIGAVNTGLYIYFNPVVTIIFDVIFLEAEIKTMGVIGTVLILIGLVVSTYKNNKKTEYEM